MTRTAAAMAMAMAACSGNPEVEPPTDSIPDITRPPPPDDTGTDIGPRTPLSPDLFAVQAFFGFDDDNDRFTNFAIPDVGLTDITFAVTFVELVTNKQCAVVYEISGVHSSSAWVTEQGAWAGMDVPLDAVVTDGCTRFSFPAQFSGDVASHVTKWDWAFGVGPLDPSVADAFAAQLPPAQWAATEPFLVGGVLYSDAFVNTELTKTGFTDLGSAIGFEVDGNFQIDTDGTGNAIPIGKDLVNTPGGIATGYYEVEFLFSGPLALTQEGGGA